MVVKILTGMAGLVLALLTVIAVNTLRFGPPRLPEISPAMEIAIDTTAMAQRLAQAVRFATVSHGREAPVAHEALRGLRNFVSQSFPRVHTALKRETINGYSLLYTWDGSDPELKPILLAAHMDVVPVEPGTEKDWTHPPFAGVVADGFVWGRGTMDMKVSLIGILEAVEYLLGQDFVPKRTIYLAFGHDEELGGPNGATKIAELLEKRGVHLYFTLDEGLVITHGIIPGVAKPAALIGLAEKGFVTLELIARGRGGHSSMPPTTTAVGRLGRAIQRLETNQMPAALRRPAADMFEHLAPEMPIMMRAILANRWLFEPLLISRLEEKAATNALIRTTTAITMIAGGVKPNVVPQEARAVINFRILPGDSVDSVTEHVQAVIDDPNIEVRSLGKVPSAPSPVSNSGSASFAALRLTVRQVFADVVVAPGLLMGRTDSRHYVRITENSYRFLPMRLTNQDLKRIHGTDERIAIDNYAEIIRFYAQLLLNTAVE